MKKSKDAGIQSFEDLYHSIAGSESQVAQVLTGNLSVEFLLRKLVAQYDKKLIKLSDELTHARLISLSQDIGTVAPQLADLLMKANTLRNRFAHHFDYRPEVSELIALFQAASSATSDYAGRICECLSNLSSASNKYSVDKWLLSELFLAIVYDLHQLYVQRGGDEDELKSTST